MAYKSVIFCTDVTYEKVKPLYDREAKRGNLEIVAHGTIDNDKVNLVYNDGKRGGGI